MPGVVSLPSHPVGLTGGLSDRITRGSGRARPGGVENIWEYNGALLNVRDWYDTFIITSIDGLADPDVRDSREVNPGRDGETYFQAFYGGRTIVISGKIRAFSLAKLRDMQMGLKQIFSDLSGEKPLYVRTGNPDLDVFIYCKKSQPIAMAETQVNFQYERDFQVTLRASNPRFLSYLEKRIALTEGWSELAPLGNPATVVGTNLTTFPKAAAGLSAPTSSHVGVYVWGSPTTPTGFTQTITNVASSLFPNGYAWRVTGNNPTAPSSGNNQVMGVKVGFQGFTPVAGKTYRFAMKFVPVVSPSYYNSIHSNTNTYSFGVVWTTNTGDITLPPDGTNFTYNGQPGGSSITLQDNVGPAIEFGVTATAPSNVTGCKLVMYTSTGSTGGADPYTFLANDVMVADAATYTGLVGFDGESATARWNSTRYASTSSLIYPTGLEGFYSTETGNQGFYLDVDGWIKPLGGNSGSTIRAVYRSDQAVAYKDLQSTIKYRSGASVGSSGFFAQYMKRLSANDYLSFQLIPNAANATLAIYAVTAAGGAQQLSVSAAGFAISPNTNYWLRSRVQGNVVTLEHWTTDPALGGTADQSITATLAGAVATQFGTGIAGGFGVRSTMDAIGSDWWWRDPDIDQVGASNLVTVTVSNEGNAPAQPNFVIYGPVSSSGSGGNAVRLGLTRVLQDGSSVTQTMWLNAKAGTTLAIPAGNYIEINTDKRTLKEYTSTGSFVRNSYDQLDISSDWLELLPGDNPVEIQNAVGAVPPTVEIRYRHTFF